MDRARRFATAIESVSKIHVSASSRSKLFRLFLVDELHDQLSSSLPETNGVSGRSVQLGMEWIKRIQLRSEIVMARFESIFFPFRCACVGPRLCVSGTMLVESSRCQTFTRNSSIFFNQARLPCLTVRRYCHRTLIVCVVAIISVNLNECPTVTK